MTYLNASWLFDQPSDNDVCVVAFDSGTWEPLPGVLGNKGTGTFIFLGTGDIFKLFSGNKGTLE